MLPTLSIDHLVFRVRDIPTSKTFYRALFGEPAFQNDDIFLYTIGTTNRLFFTKATSPASTPYDKEHVGLNHMAFGVESLAHLEQIHSHLQSAGIPNSGIGIDPQGKQNYIWLNDPNGLRIEFYCTPPSQ